MRYDNWDVILFPEDSNVPIPEYRTACYLSRDEDGHELPILRTYIGSLKPETPFRISLHHWGPPKPSPFIQHVQQRVGMNIAFTVQIVIDGVRLYHGSFELDNASPQEIAFEQRSFKSSRTKEQPTSQARAHLLFPRSDKNTLLQSSAWQPRGLDNRIKITLSEQLVGERDLLDSDYYEIVCFSFQHAPRELLEQAGIAYPITDPLRLLMAEQASLVAKPLHRSTVAHETIRGFRNDSAHSPGRDFKHTRQANPEPYQQPPNQQLSLPHHSYPLMGSRIGGHPDIWYNTHGAFGEYDDSMGMASFPSQQSASTMSGFYNPSLNTHTIPPWARHGTLPGPLTRSVVSSKRSRAEHGMQPAMLSIRQDQFGQMREAISPSRKERNISNGLSIQQHHHRPPKIGALSVPVRPSSAAMPRTSATLDLDHSSRDRRPSSGQANFDSTTSVRSTSRAMRPTSKRENHDTIIHQPIPFMLAPQRYGSDVSVRDGSPNFSGLSRFETDPRGFENTIGSAHAPSAVSYVKSRKEGLTQSTDASPELDVRRDQRLTPEVNMDTMTKAKSVSNDPAQTPRNRTDDAIEVIDVDAIDLGLTADLEKLSPYRPSHKAGMSSVSSTGRLERQLYSALGEELGSYEQQLNVNGMGPELAQALSGGSHSNLSGSPMLDCDVNESEPIKRKRQGTLGGERDKSPLKKKERSRQARVNDEGIPDDMPRLRGD